MKCYEFWFLEEKAGDVALQAVTEINEEQILKKRVAKILDMADNFDYSSKGDADADLYEEE